MGVRLITGPTEEPVTLTEAKAHLRIEHTLDDADITRHIVTARKYVEQVTWRALMSQTWEKTLDTFPDERRILLPKGDVQSITSLKYDNASDVETTFAAGSYILSLTDRGWAVRLKADYDWPDTSDNPDAVRVRFVAGYGAASAVPEPLKHAILLLVSQLYELRVPEVVGTIVSKVGFAVDALVDPYRVNEV